VIRLNLPSKIEGRPNFDFKAPLFSIWLGIDRFAPRKEKLIGRGGADLIMTGIGYASGPIGVAAALLYFAYARYILLPEKY